MIEALYQLIIQAVILLMHVYLYTLLSLNNLSANLIGMFRTETLAGPVSREIEDLYLLELGLRIICLSTSAISSLDVIGK